MGPHHADVVAEVLRSTLADAAVYRRHALGALGYVRLWLDRAANAANDPGAGDYYARQAGSDYGAFRRLTERAEECEAEAVRLRGLLRTVTACEVAA